MSSSDNFNLKNGLFFLPLGGVGEIGANCYLYCSNNSWIMIDLGVSFADEKFPGIDLLVPNLDFIDKIKDKLEAIIISHGHEDHAGAIPFYADKINCPIYATNFVYNLLLKKFKDYKISDKIKLKKIETNKVLSLNEFEFSFLETTHSIPEPYAILIKTNYGNILHTADWKIDKNPIIGNSFNPSLFKKISEENLLALVGDSTNANVSGSSGSEKDVQEHLKNLFSRYDKRIVITCFSSNISRLQSIADAAKKNNRHIAVLGRSLKRMIETAIECGYLKNLTNIVSEDEIQYFSRENIVIICTGSQGEKKSALYRIAYNSHSNIYLEKGDLVIFSSKDIPGNEKSINNLKNLLIKKKIEIISNEDEFVHVSGHGSIEEIKKMYEWTRPVLSVPVHGEPLHLLEHEKIAKSCQVPYTKILENGSLLKIGPQKPEVINKIETGKMIVEGGKIYNSESDFIRQRIKYSYEGIIMITLIINKDLSINKDIIITHYGLPIANMEEFTSNFKINFIESYLKLEKNNNISENDDSIKHLCKKVIKKYCMNQYKRKPEVQTHIIRSK